MVCAVKPGANYRWSGLYFSFLPLEAGMGDDLTLQRASIAAWPFPCPVHQWGEVYYGEMSVQLIWKMNS